MCSSPSPTCVSRPCPRNPVKHFCNDRMILYRMIYRSKHIFTRKFRLKFCWESVTLRGFWLCCFSRQNFKWNPWLLMLFTINNSLLYQPRSSTRLFFFQPIIGLHCVVGGWSTFISNSIRSEGFHLKFCLEKQHSQNPPNVTISRQNFNRNFSE